MLMKFFKILKVRHKVKEIIEFIQSDDKLREERLKAKKNRDKYVGIDSDNIRTSSSSHSGGFSDYSRSGFGSTGGFGSEGGRKSNIPDLDDKEWRSSNPTITERISDITSKVKELMDVPPNNDHNLDISDNEEDLGIGIGKFEDKKTETSPSSNKLKLDLKPASNSSVANNKNSAPPKKVQEKKQQEQVQPDLLGLDNDDFDDFVSHRIVPEASNNNNTTNIQQKNTSSIDLFSNDGPISSINAYSPLPSSNQPKSNNLDNSKHTANVDLFDIGIPEEASGSIDLFSLGSQTTTANSSNIITPSASKTTNSSSDFDFFDFGGPVTATGTFKPMMPSSATLPNLNLLVVYLDFFENCMCNSQTKLCFSLNLDPE